MCVCVCAKCTSCFAQLSPPTTTGSVIMKTISLTENGLDKMVI